MIADEIVIRPKGLPTPNEAAQSAPSWLSAIDAWNAFKPLTHAHHVFHTPITKDVLIQAINDFKRYSAIPRRLLLNRNGRADWSTINWNSLVVEHTDVRWRAGNIGALQWPGHSIQVYYDGTGVITQNLLSE